MCSYVYCVLNKSHKTYRADQDAKIEFIISAVNTNTLRLSFDICHNIIDIYCQKVSSIIYTVNIVQ